MTEHSKSDLKRLHILETGRALVVRHGFGGVGLARLLKECGIPKGSFYHYFSSKEDFGKALLEHYVATYLARFDALIAGPGTARDRLDRFWTAWLAQAGGAGIASQCLVVKLGAEVADLSDPMRAVLNDGIAELVQRIALLLRAGAEDGSLRRFDDPEATARMLYATWLGAAILAKLDRSQVPLQQALAETNNQLSSTS
ncbi:TetR/AcrR family transcriptional regulator [Marinovum sp.]|uniref:TetR/AcrR family transcriptional regulator n=1 Tax=Marinovum sp. TaxID=2024839 RepID=UPI002B2722C5|nr:TetR/AcrR family transcriptional regulator [Marinovum sp.]